MTEATMATDRFAGEIDDWLEALHPAAVAEARASQGDRKLARWARNVAGFAAVELLRPKREDRQRLLDADMPA